MPNEDLWESPTKYMIIPVVTVTGRGPHPKNTHLNCELMWILSYHEILIQQVDPPIFASWIPPKYCWQSMSQASRHGSFRKEMMVCFFSLKNIEVTSLYGHFFFRNSDTFYSDTASTLPEPNSSPLKIGRLKRKRSYSTHPFSGAMLISGRVLRGPP